MNEVLKVHELTKAFGSTNVLDGISFRMKEGEVISLIGSSGCGKSTALRCINFLETPTSGQIEFMGQAISVNCNKRGESEIVNGSYIRAFRQRIGMVFQNFNLWPHRTVLGNVTEALVYVLKLSRKEAEEVALSALSKVGMASFRDRYPHQLSGGQQQRVAFARVLAMRPKLMLCDEPTSALDPELVGEVLKVIRTLAEEGATILLVTHEMRFARDVSNRMIFLQEGRLEQDDTPEELLRNPATEAVKRFLSSVMPASAQRRLATSNNHKRVTDMIISKIIKSALATSLLVSALAMAASAKDGVLRIGTEGDAPKFSMADPSGNVTGFDADIANGICAELKLKCEFVVQTFSSLVPSMDSDRFDVIISGPWDYRRAPEEDRLLHSLCDHASLLRRREGFAARRTEEPAQISKKPSKAKVSASSPARPTPSSSRSGCLASN